MARILITLGVLFLLGLLTDLLGRRTPLPRVTLLILFGFVVGPSVVRSRSSNCGNAGGRSW